MQERKPKAEAKGSFLVLHPPSSAYTVNTVGSNLKFVRDNNSLFVRGPVLSATPTKRQDINVSAIMKLRLL